MFYMRMITDNFCCASEHDLVVDFTSLSSRFVQLHKLVNTHIVLVPTHGGWGGGRLSSQ